MNTRLKYYHELKPVIIKLIVYNQFGGNAERNYHRKSKIRKFWKFRMTFDSTLKILIFFSFCNTVLDNFASAKVLL